MTSQDGEQAAQAPNDNCSKWNYNDPHHWVYISQYGVCVGICSGCHEPNLKELKRDADQARQRLIAEVRAVVPEKHNNWSDVPDEAVGGLPSYSKKLTYRKAHNNVVNTINKALEKMEGENGCQLTNGLS